ncbi:MAG: GTPase HflX [Thermoplasmata archaeon]
MVQEKVIIITPKDDEEFLQLAESLNYEIVNVFYFRHYSSRYFIGEGKLREIISFLEENPVEKILLNGVLKSVQWYNLEKMLKTGVYDRIMLILEVFSDRAKSKEASLEVELSKLNYQIPLLKEWIHRSRKGEHPGFMAGGEYDIDQYYFLVQKRIKNIKKELEKIKKERNERRKIRIRNGFYLVSIAGYTNSGKSQLMRTISGEDVVVENRMFSTLVSKISRIQGIKKKILITDTVGFIRNLPPWIIEAFYATLEDVFYSDLIILLIDAHDDFENFKEKFITSLDILKRESRSNILPVLNKIDLQIDDIEKKFNYVKDELSEPLKISAKTGEGMDKLIEKIVNSLKYDREFNVTISAERDYMPLLSFIYEYGELEKLEQGNKINIVFKINSRFSGEIRKLIQLLND